MLESIIDGIMGVAIFVGVALFSTFITIAPWLALVWGAVLILQHFGIL